MKQLDAQQFAAAAPRILRLPADLLAEIHHRLPFLQRLAFAASVCGASGQNLRETPWLLLPEPHNPEYHAKATVLSIADGKGKSAAVATSAVALRGHVAIGSSGGWLVTAGDRGDLRVANPVTGAHADLPAITTVPFIRGIHGGVWFRIDIEPLLQIRFGGLPPPEHKNFPRTFTVTAYQMRQMVYRKVVLSASPRPGSYAAMLITDRSTIGAQVAFTTSEDPVWRMAASRDGVEDAVHHGGRFLSITYTGHVEAWRRDVETGEFTSEAVAPRLAAYEDEHRRRKYVAVTTDGRLMVVLKHSREEENPNRRYRSVFKDRRVFFKIQMLYHDKGRWEEVADIGDAAIFVGVNGSLCLSTREHNKGIAPGCVYFTDDDVGAACVRNKDTEIVDELRDVGVYSLKDGTVSKIDGVSKEQLWPPPAWFTPSFL